MRFHLLQHVSFEGPAEIEGWLKDNHHSLTITRFYLDGALPAQEDFDVLIVMGGPMGVEDVELYPWLIDEREFIQVSIHNNKTILGICLGAQMIARACGANVGKNKYPEIGWFNISIKNTEKFPAVLQNVFPETVEVFHWHGDTFEIPDNALLFASSEVCANQGYILNDRVIGLQFHIETTADSVELLVNNCRADLDESVFVQSEEKIREKSEKYKSLNQMLFDLLKNIVDLNL